MKNRNEGYIKRGHVIDVQIRDEYYVSAFIKPVNKDKTEFRFRLYLHDSEAGSLVEIGKTINLSSTYKTVESDVHKILKEMIDHGDFNKDVDSIENLYQYTKALIELRID